MQYEERDRVCLSFTVPYIYNNRFYCLHLSFMDCLNTSQENINSSLYFYTSCTIYTLCAYLDCTELGTFMLDTYNPIP